MASLDITTNPRRSLMEFGPSSDRDTGLRTADRDKGEPPFFEWRPSRRESLTGDSAPWRRVAPRPINLERRAKFARLNFQAG